MGQVEVPAGCTLPADEVPGRLAELAAAAGTLRAALAAGCDDLVDCAGTPGCPVPGPAPGS